MFGNTKICMYDVSITKSSNMYKLTSQTGEVREGLGGGKKFSFDIGGKFLRAKTSYRRHFRYYSCLKYNTIQFYI
jgi:hypothetical protein